MSKKPSRKMQEAEAWGPTVVGVLASLVFLILSYCVRPEEACGRLHEICFSILPVASLTAATIAYFRAKSDVQEKLSAFTAIIITTVMLVTFSEESKNISFFAAVKQFSMVLLAGATTLFFRSTLADPKWQRSHDRITAVVAAAALAYPFIAGLNKWPYREGLSDVCAIFVASTFGTMYLKQKADKKSRS